MTRRGSLSSRAVVTARRTARKRVPCPTQCAQDIQIAAHMGRGHQPCALNTAPTAALSSPTIAVPKASETTRNPYSP